jgi:hypothetical protein
MSRCPPRASTDGDVRARALAVPQTNTAPVEAGRDRERRPDFRVPLMAHRLL